MEKGAKRESKWSPRSDQNGQKEPKGSQRAAQKAEKAGKKEGKKEGGKKDAQKRSFGGNTGRTGGTRQSWVLSLLFYLSSDILIFSSSGVSRQSWRASSWFLLKCPSLKVAPISSFEGECRNRLPLGSFSRHSGILFSDPVPASIFYVFLMFFSCFWALFFDDF